MAQRTVYDEPLPAGMTKRRRDRLLDALAEQYPDADVTLVTLKPATGPARHRIVAKLKRSPT